MESVTVRTWNFFFVLFTLIGLGWLIYLLAPILTPFLTGALLAYFVDPLVKQLMRLHISRLFSVIIIFSLLFSLIVLLILFLVPLIQDQLENLFDAIPNIINWVQQTAIPWFSNQLGVHGSSISTIKSTLVENLTNPGDTAGKFFNS